MKVIYHNLKIIYRSRFKHLTKDERTRLYVCHELGHAVNDEWLKTFSNYVHCPNNKIKNMNYYTDFAKPTRRFPTSKTVWYAAMKRSPRTLKIYTNPLTLCINLKNL